jgi:hypothetical protein
MIHLAFRHRIHDRHENFLLQEGVAFRYERFAAFGLVLVPGANDLHCGRLP